MNILVVDGNDSMCLLLKAILESDGHNVHAVNSGAKALSCFKVDRLTPDLVILDVIMEDMDGYEVARQLNGFAAEQYLPIVFLTGSKDPEALARCLELGVDFIAKPFDEESLLCRVNAHLRASREFRKLQEQNQGLLHYRRMVQQEHSLIEAIFNNQFERYNQAIPNLRYHMSPASVFHGDVLLSAVGPTGSTYLVIGDVTGHGLPAAIGAIPVFSTFRAMAAKGLPVGAIAAEMNSHLRRILPSNMLLAACLLEINAAGDQVSVWPGGLPAMVIADPKGALVELMPSKHGPLAMLEEVDFDISVDVYRLQQGHRIFLFTDGIEESCNAEGQMYSEPRLHGLFDGSDANVFQRILNDLDDFAGDANQGDDITLVEFTHSDRVADVALVEEGTIPEKLVPWSVNVTLGADELKGIDPVPQIIRLVSSAYGLDVHQDFVSTILSEMFSNALEHGILELDSNLKSSDDGFLEYYQLRSQRLRDLQQGQLSVTLTYQPDQPAPLLKLRVSDSGAGFDYSQVQSGAKELGFGNGINIINELCEHREYSDGGSTMEVHYRLIR